jgi:hypothetical protein
MNWVVIGVGVGFMLLIIFSLALKRWMMTANDEEYPRKWQMGEKECEQMGEKEYEKEDERVNG